MVVAPLPCRCTHILRVGGYGSVSSPFSLSLLGAFVYFTRNFSHTCSALIRVDSVPWHVLSIVERTAGKISSSGDTNPSLD